MKVFYILGSLRLLIITAAVALGLGYAADVRGQQLRTAAQMENLLERLETSTDRFSRSLDAALDRSSLDDSKLEDQANALVDELEFATDRLEDRADDNIVNSYDVNEVLRRGMYLDMFMQRHQFSPAAERDWLMLRTDLELLARIHSLTWTWVPKTTLNSAVNKGWVRQVIHRLEETTDEFRSSFDAGLDRSRIDGSAREDFMNTIMAQFERSVDKLEEDAESSKQLDPTDVRLALTNAGEINDFLKRHTLPERTRRDWARVKANLDDLAFITSQVPMSWW